MNQETEQIKTPEFVTLNFQLAGLGSRGAALILDMLILLIGNGLLGLLLYFISKNRLWFFFVDPALLLGLMIIALFVIYWGYFFVCEFFFAGKTVGKRLIGIRVIQDNGHSLTLLSAFIRNLLRIIDMLPTAYFLGMIMVFFHPKHKRLGDVTAGTLVVHERKAKRSKTVKKIEKEIQSRGISKDQLSIDKGSLRTLGTKDWKLIKTYSTRLLQLPQLERKQRTKQVASILLPKVGLDTVDKNEQELENLLLVLYLILKDEWEFE
ncbi:MAG TPA: RDD family protein [Bacillales bacterium]